MKYSKRIVIIGGGIAGANAATKLVDNGYPGELITIIDKGKDPYKRKPEEVMEGWLGSGGWSDGKLTYHTAIGGQLSKYCGDEKAYELMDQVINNFRRFHPKPEMIFCSNPTAEPEFIKPYFNLRLFPVWHIGTDYLAVIAQNWFDFLVSKGIKFKWEKQVGNINFDEKTVISQKIGKQSEYDWVSYDYYDELILCTGKSGIDFSQKISEQYKLETEPKSVQIGVRFEAPQKYFQKLIDVSYDFKLYQKPNNQVSLRSFCTNNEAAYVAVEETYGDVTYNGHAKKDPKFKNDMTNFGILMEIKGIENPFDWCRNVVKQCQAQSLGDIENLKENWYNIGLYWSPSRRPSKTSEGNQIECHELSNLNSFHLSFGDYAGHILQFIEDMNKVFNFGDDWGMYIPEVKYLSPEPLVNYKDLSLNDYSNVHFAGDALSARGITVAGSHGIYIAESILK
jgi:uncharacterized FAD-dependent dehydrogenase